MALMIFLTVVVIVLLAYLISTINSKFVELEYKFRDLQRSIESLKRPHPVEKPVETPVEKPAIREQPPLEIPKPIIKVEDVKPFAVVEKEEVKEPIPVNFVAAEVPTPDYQRPQPTPYIPEKSWWEDFKEKNPDLEKFIGENLINKIGVLILVLGISYFVKFAIDKNWINEPARAGIGILSGALVMGFAHKLRKNYAAFSSVLVAGAISIFYFTIGIAFHDYELFSQTVAFIIMVVITAFSCVISLSYNRKELAVLSLIGGFAVPFMVSTGSGNYVVLFTYIIILNIGILALAYSRKWSIINILSYIFTVILYGGWLYGELLEKQPHYLGALLFGFAFYLIFIAINIINNLRTKGVFSAVELAVLASNTFLFYLAGMVILTPWHPELKGLFTTVLALLNLLYSWLLYKKFGLDKTAVYLLIGLTLTFATLAIPIQFEGNYITLFWAAEAVVLMWLSQKSRVFAYRIGSVVVTILMLGSLVMDWVQIYTGNEQMKIVVNPIFITGVFVIVSLVAVLWLLKNENENQTQFGFVFNPAKYKSTLLSITLVISYFTGMFEVVHQSDYYIDINSASAIPFLYHLLFCAVLCHFLWKNEKYIGVATFISIANILLFAFFFSNVPFVEHEAYVNGQLTYRTAFYLHYVSLAIVIYTAYQLYKNRGQKPVAEFLNKGFIIWTAAFMVVFIASSELMLHGMFFANDPVTIQDVNSSSYSAELKNGDFTFVRGLVADDSVQSVRSQIIKTGFPILWGVLAFIFLIIGIKRQNKTIRIIALTVLGVTILKLFLYDIRNASETGKIIAFILLGVLILIISFVYQKIKVLVLDDAKTSISDDTK